MATVRFYLDTRNLRQDGTYALKLIVDHNQGIPINLKVYLTPEQWDEDSKQIVKHPNRVQLNFFIKQRKTAVENLLLSLQAQGILSRLTPKELKKRINAIGTGEEVGEVLNEEECKLKPLYERFVSRLTNLRTKELYRSTLNKIDSFSSVESLTFTQVSYDWLHDFEQHLKQTVPSINARAIHLRNIRAIFNSAIDEGKVSLNDYPFRRFKIRKQQTIKRSLTVEQLRLIRDTQWTPKVQEAADFFMLSFYLIGINIIDILHLKELLGDKIAYHRAKTGRLYEFRVPQEALSIFEKYKGGEYLLSWRERYRDYRGFTGIVNERCKEIGKAIGAPTLTTYYARHTWATLAASLDIPKETIAAALGHAEHSVTDVYINFDQRKIDEANKRVIAYLMEA
ncbi:MAG: site-specific integrase [Prevotellaceae bacterium]|jgi:integrase|nr:site-specific integrase [Prevotellaceae bacterium]